MPVFIEDVDRNGNNLPDAWEVANGSTLNPGANNVTDVLTGGIAVNKALSELIERENATLPGGMAGQIMTTLASPSFQAMVFGLDMPAGRWPMRRKSSTDPWRSRTPSSTRPRRR